MTSRFRVTRFRAAAIAAASFFILSQVTRLALLVMARHDLATNPVAIARALATGAVYDVAVASWLILPLTLYLALPGERRFHGRVNGFVVRAWMFAGAMLGIFVALAEVFFFDEFTSRFNFVAVDYLVYPTEVTTNLRESYPLGWLLGGILLLAGAYLFAIRRPLRDALEAATPGRRRVLTPAAHLAVAVILSVVLTPSLGRVSDDRTLNEIAGNGWYTFFEALLGQDAPYEGLYATDPPASEARRLATLLAEPQLVAGTLRADGTTLRHVAPRAPLHRLNVVVVLEESLGSEFVDVLHPHDTSLTPHFDSLATEGALLTRAYSTGNRTIRALEATTASLPPLPGISIVRRPASQDLFTLPEVLREHGYATEFIYGGRALFDGMGTYMRANGVERVIEQGDFPGSDFHTAWGVADEFIFDRALTEMDSLSRTGRPFYTLILSVSNHRPYTFPAGRTTDDPGGHRRAFAVRYADWALGRFMRQAQSHAWYDSTLFVLMGDHGARVYGASEIPLPSYEVPVLFYAPRFIAPGTRIGTLASSLDVPPTILARLGMPYDSRFFGRDVFSLPPDAGRALMTHNNELALMRGDDVAVLGLRGAAQLYRYDHVALRLLPVAHPDSAGRELLREAITYFHTADRLYRSGAYRALDTDAGGNGG